MASTVKTLIEINEIVSDYFSTKYYNHLDKQASQLHQLYETKDGHGRTINFSFMLNNAVVDWLEEFDPILFRELEGYNVEINYKQLGGGLRMPILDRGTPIFDSLIMDQVDGLVKQMQYAPAARIASILDDGDSDTYYTMWDGQLLFSNSHSINGETWDNLQAGALSATTFETGMEVLQSVPWGPEGDNMFMAATKYYLVVPPGLGYTAKKLMADVYDGTTTSESMNIYKGEAEVVVHPNLSDANDWYILAEYPGQKPLVKITNNQHPATLIPLTDPRDQNMVNNNEYRWFVKEFVEIYPTQFFQMVKFVVN